MTDKMLLAKQGAVATITFNNPEKRNAVSQEMWAAIPDMFDDIEADPAIRAVVVTGAGGASFVSGADISEFEKNRNSVENARRYGETSNCARDRLKHTPKPTIAMIRGYCIGGGLAVAMSCDLRIATEGSTFGVPAAKLGIGYGEDSVRPLVALVGPSAAKRILYTGRRIDAAAAFRLGLIDEAVADAELERTVASITADIAENAPLSILAAKGIVDELGRDTPDLALCTRLVESCFASADYAEGRRAFLEKRKPVFAGR